LPRVTPIEKQQYLVHDGIGYHVATWTGTEFSHPDYRHERFTHWRDLPSPPPPYHYKAALDLAIHAIEVHMKNRSRPTWTAGQCEEADDCPILAKVLPSLRAAMDA
jgi:hypothetical protein